MKNLLILGSSSIALKRLPKLIEQLSSTYNIKIILTKQACEMNLIKDSHIISNALITKELEPIHIQLNNWADEILIYPATYNIIGKYSSGIADDLVSTILSVAPQHKVIVCPAMNSAMYLNPINQSNINSLKKLGVRFLGPIEGDLYCKTKGIGHIIEPEDVKSFLNKTKKSKLLLAMGKTRVYLDDVRYVEANSSGKMGIALIEALQFSYDVTVILVNLTLPTTYVVNVLTCSTVEEYQKLVSQEIINSDVFISAIAVSDIIFKKINGKIKKDIKHKFEYHQGIDILKMLTTKYPNKFYVGFALESDNLLMNAKAKKERKKVDLLVANNQTALSSDTTSGYLITNDLDVPFACQKEELAILIAKHIHEK